MEDIDLMWIAYFDMSEKDQDVVAVEINVLQRKTELSLLESMYVLWKLGRYMSRHPGVIE